MDVTVSDIGLLGTTSSTHTSETGQILGGLAAFANIDLSPYSMMIKSGPGSAVAPSHSTKECPMVAGQTYAQYIRFDRWNGSPATICGFEFTILSTGREDLAKDSAEFKENLKGFQNSNRIFYRQKVRMLIEVTKNDAEARQFFLPIVDPTQFSSVEIPRTLFSDNTSSFTFTDGILTSYKPKIESEVLAAVTLPATAITAYLKAVGSIFDAFKTSSQNESEYYKTIMGLQQQKLKYQSCMAAVAQKLGDAAIIAACTSN